MKRGKNVYGWQYEPYLLQKAEIIGGQWNESLFNGAGGWVKNVKIFDSILTSVFVAYFVSLELLSRKLVNLVYYRGRLGHGLSFASGKYVVFFNTGLVILERG